MQIATRRLLEGPSKPEALFCWTDFIALEVISVATELGLRIPQDLAIVGYDNTMYCDFAQNGLTSVDQSGELLGLQSARPVIERIRGRAEAEHFVVTPRVVARNSSKRRAV
ncbi:substrate-binding domain-containing protein [Devosia sp. A8/3-2]|nr:substrate-binding domain-containing protein [Devosia sp. A8/3-2]